MKTDAQLQKDVMDELKWEPLLSASEVGVSVKNGIVTLSGMVDTYSKKLAAEKAVKRVQGVKAVAEDIQVGVSTGFRKSDAEIAEACLSALKWHTAVQEEKIKLKVEKGGYTAPVNDAIYSECYSLSLRIDRLQFDVAPSIP
ncbi:MAG: BON domain-containing protein [Bacteroidetes bacterium]|nr:BON domain-containing protein [Bacteroidota bacterium]